LVLAAGFMEGAKELGTIDGPKEPGDMTEEGPAVLADRWFRTDTCMV
jgi:hypothetical protein